MQATACHFGRYRAGRLTQNRTRCGVDPASESPEAARFAETPWSAIAAAARSEAPGAAAALEKLCRDYWYPLYAFLRRRGYDREDAEDLTQGFFAERVITRRVLRDLSPERGRFRSWLLASLKNYV